MSESDDSERDRGDGKEQRQQDGSESDRSDGKEQRQQDGSERDHGDGKDRQRRQADGGKKPLSPARLARRACNDLAELLGREIEGVVSLERSDDGWCVGIEVLEIARVPDTADVLAEYEVLTDRRGRLRGYHRVRRYTRASTQVEQ